MTGGQASTKGFAASRLEDIAVRAGVTKGTLYLYYATKEALFEAAVKPTRNRSLEICVTTSPNSKGGFELLLHGLLATASDRIATGRIPAVAKMVIAEAQNFPELATVWQREVVKPISRALASRIRAAQKRGEFAPGPPETYAILVVSPILVAMLSRQVFGDRMLSQSVMKWLADIHTKTLLHGMILPKSSRSGRNPDL